MSTRLITGTSLCSRLDKISSILSSAVLANKNSRFFHQTPKSDSLNVFRYYNPNVIRNVFCEFSIYRIVPISSSICTSLSRALTISTSPAQILVLGHTTEACENRRPFLENKRGYAKGKDKVKSGKSNVVIREDEIGQLVDVRALKAQLEDLVNEMKEEFAQSLSIRGASGHLETLQVEFDGQSYPLQELAQVGRKNPQMAVLNLSSLPEACQAVMQAIQESGMNVNPQQEGTTIYVPLPKVTREHRENLAKNAKVLFTKYKVLLQGVQNRYVKEGKRQTEMSEDLIYSVQHQIMKLTEGYIAEAEKLMVTKQKELLDTK